MDLKEAIYKAECYRRGTQLSEHRMTGRLVLERIDHLRTDVLDALIDAAKKLDGFQEAKPEQATGLGAA